MYTSSLLFQHAVKPEAIITTNAPDSVQGTPKECTEDDKVFLKQFVSVFVGWVR